MMKKLTAVILALLSLLILSSCGEDVTKKMSPQEILDVSEAGFSQVKNYTYSFAIKAAQYAQPVVTDAPDVNTDEEAGNATPPPGADVGGGDGEGEGEGEPVVSASPDASVSPQPSTSPEVSVEPSPTASDQNAPAPSAPIGAQYDSAFSSTVYLSPTLMTKSTLAVDNPVPITAEAYFSQEGTDYFMYEKPGDTWINRRLANDKTVNEYFKLHFVDSYTVLKSYIKDLKTVGTEKDKDGKELIKLEGTLSADTMPMLLFQAGFSVTGAETSKALGDMPLTIWVDSKDYKLSRITIDLTQNLNVLMDEAQKVGSEDADTTKITLTYASVLLDCTFTGYDKAPAVALPADAKSQPAQDFNPYTTSTDDAS